MIKALGSEILFTTEATTQKGGYLHDSSQHTDRWESGGHYP
jgi:hypothetical protein